MNIHKAVAIPYVRKINNKNSTLYALSFWEESGIDPDPLF